MPEFYTIEIIGIVLFIGFILFYVGKLKEFFDTNEWNNKDYEKEYREILLKRKWAIKKINYEYHEQLKRLSERYRK